MKASEILREAKALIDTPEKWTQRASRRRVGDHWCYCAIGALSEAKRQRALLAPDAGMAWVAPDTGGAWACLYDALSDPHINSIADFNDDPTTTHADVMAFYDRAIAEAERSEAE